MKKLLLVPVLPLLTGALLYSPSSAEADVESVSLTLEAPAPLNLGTPVQVTDEDGCYCGTCIWDYQEEMLYVQGIHYNPVKVVECFEAGFGEASCQDLQDDCDEWLNDECPEGDPNCAIPKK